MDVDDHHGMGNSFSLIGRMISLACFVKNLEAGRILVSNSAFSILIGLSDLLEYCPESHSVSKATRRADPRVVATKICSDGSPKRLATNHS